MDTTTDRSALEGKLIPELQRIAQTLGIEGSQKLRKAGLIDAIVATSGDGSSSGMSSDSSNPGASSLMVADGAGALAQTNGDTRTDTPEGRDAAQSDRGDQHSR